MPNKNKKLMTESFFKRAMKHLAPGKAPFQKFPPEDYLHAQDQIDQIVARLGIRRKDWRSDKALVKKVASEMLDSDVPHYMIDVMLGHDALFNESTRAKTFLTTTGKQVPYGSSKHINELEHTLNSLLSARARRPRGTAARTDLTRTISRIKSELQKARKAGALDESVILKLRDVYNTGE